jgi:RsiW-degrading membrane proteinase PrsW (M82 family)
MPITFACPACGKKVRAPDTLAGKERPCPGCGARLTIPAAEEEAPTYSVEPEEKPAQRPSPPPVPQNDPEAEPAPRRLKRPRPTPEAEASDAEAELAPRGPKRLRPPAEDLPPLRSKEAPLWLRHLHWLLALALLPLAVSILPGKQGRDGVEDRLQRTLENAPPEVRSRVVAKLADLEKDKGSVEDLFAVLPGHKLAGAMLARDTWAHWGFAFGAAWLFLLFFVLLAADRSAQIVHLVMIALFTATIGILLLLLFEVLADWSQGVWVHGRSIVVLIFYIVKLIGFSYRAALDPNNGFLLSFFGYTLGVGFCEEVCKMLPLLWHYRQSPEQTWRAAFIWGLASGAGFGISEGVLYASRYYNGISGPDMYLIRFLSCVALHAVWTGAAAIMLYRNQHLFQQQMEWYEYFPPLLFVVGIPMVLHGLYDTLLKKDMDAGALVVAVVSFLFLAVQIILLHRADDQASKEEMLREYKRRRRLGLA